MSQNSPRYLAEIAHFEAGTTPRENLEKAIENLKAVNETRRFVLGTQIQEATKVQLTSEWSDIHDGTKDEISSNSGLLITSLHSIYGEPKSLYHVTFNKSLFGPNEAATANVVEYARSWFPASQVTPEFEKKIEEDFLRFNAICEKEAKGNLDWATGWILEEQDHEKVEGKAKCFLVLRGWQSMSAFEQLTKSAVFPEAISILLAWNAPFKMWHVERKS